MFGLVVWGGGSGWRWTCGASKGYGGEMDNPSSPAPPLVSSYTLAPDPLLPPLDVSVEPEPPRVLTIADLSKATYDPTWLDEMIVFHKGRAMRFGDMRGASEPPRGNYPPSSTWGVLPVDEMRRGFAALRKRNT